ncbi:MAG TPA: DmsC/YnfH family molybdoenzyme membrane anchor subunit [Rhodanobacteraceae bacterium]|nr:DmsC/YnfH family molybdoenzyme membrane anchor subunit [Rhodanobacteraceae bacterium]
MRPTFAIIFFTVLSGAGYGLWFLLGVGLVAWWPTCTPTFVPDQLAPVPFCVYPGLIPSALFGGFALVTVGLLSSVAHLGRPLRAWRALSQWRSSWLSREGIASLLTYLPAAGIALVTLLAWWYSRGVSPGESIEAWFPPGYVSSTCGALLALGAVVTVYCTANIYASLRPVRAWNNRFVTHGYLVLALYSGTLLFCALAMLPYGWVGPGTPALFFGVVILAAYCALLKRLYWRDIDRAPRIDTGHATGLDAQGIVRSFEQPHTEENYLTHEMGFVLARKHATKLRAIAMIAAFALPAVLAAFAIALPALRAVAAWLALMSGMLGIFVERWLFFAEARHAVIAYYGR